MILITGALGFLGQRVVRRLLDHNITELRILLRPGAPLGVLEHLSSLHRNIECVQCDLADEAGLISVLQGVAIVVHLAASKQGGAAAQVANTVVSSDHLFKACVKAKIDRCIVISSFAVMDAFSARKRGVIDENTGFEPHPEYRDPYSFTKCLQEKLAWKYYRQQQLPLIVLRPGVIYGEGEPLLSPRIGLSLFGVFLHLGHSNTIPLTYVDNCADAIVAAVNQENIIGEAFCIVDDELPQSKIVLNYYKKHAKSKRIISVPIPYFILWLMAIVNEWYFKRTKGHLPLVFSRYKIGCMWRGHAFSNNKAKNLLGWQPLVTIAKGMARTVKNQPE